MAERDFFKYVIHRRCLLCCLLITLALVSIITFAARSSLERLTTAISDTSASIVRTAYADDASSSPANQATIPRLTVYQAPATVPNASGANLSVALDGQAVSFDVQPFIKSGRVMVPVRAISEALGAVVRYDDSTMTVTITKGSNVIILIVGSSVAEDGNPIMLDVPAEVVDGRIFVPIRFVAEAMGCQVDWFEGANYAYNLDNGLNHWRAALADLDAGSSTLYNLCVLVTRLQKANKLDRERLRTQQRWPYGLLTDFAAESETLCRQGAILTVE